MRKLIPFFLLCASYAYADTLSIQERFVKEQNVNVSEQLTTLQYTIDDGALHTTLGIGQGKYEGYLLKDNSPFNSSSRHFNVSMSYDVNNKLTLKGHSWVRDIAPSKAENTREVMTSLGVATPIGPIYLEGGITRQKTGVGSFVYPYAKLGGDIPLTGGLSVMFDVTKTKKSDIKNNYYQPSFTIVNVGIGMKF